MRRLSGTSVATPFATACDHRTRWRRGGQPVSARQVWRALWLSSLTLIGLAPPTAAVQRGPELTAETARAFADDVLMTALDEGRVPGALLTVVYRGEVLLADGFGLANAMTGEQASSQTVFRVGSLSKPVTATMLARLADLGRFDLHADTRDQLGSGGFGERHDQAVTAVHLLTHTSGLDVTDVGDAARTPDGLMSLTEFVERRMVAQVSPPGEFYRYTNHGYALAGRLAEIITDTPFAEAAQELVFAPLRMKSTSFEQPPPSPLRERMAVGHEVTNSAIQTLTLDYSLVAPADGLVTTAPDMALFLLAQLEDDRLLSRAARESLHQTRFSYSSEFAGRTLGFEEERSGAQRGEYGVRRFLTHTGGQLGFTSELLLYPDERLGLFIALNRRDWQVRWNVFDEFFARFFPTDRVEPATITGVADMAATSFERAPVPASTFEAVGSMLEPDRIQLAVSGDEMVLRRGDDRTVLRPLSQHGFLSTDLQTRVVLSSAEDQVRNVFVNGVQYRSSPWWTSGETHTLLFVGSTIAFLAAVPFWPLARRARRRSEQEPSEAVWIGRLAATHAALHVLYVVIFVAGLVHAAAAGGFDYGLTPLMIAGLVLPWALVPVTFGIGASLWLAVHRGYWGPVLRVALAGQLAVSALVLVVTFARSLASW